MNHPEFSAKSKIQGILMQEIFSLLQMSVFQLFVLSLPFFNDKINKAKFLKASYKLFIVVI
jgi:hypothetical protein